MKITNLPHSPHSYEEEVPDRQTVPLVVLPWGSSPKVGSEKHKEPGVAKAGG